MFDEKERQLQGYDIPTADIIRQNERQISKMHYAGGVDKRAVCIRWTGLGTGLWDWTHRKLRSSFLKARKQEIAERHYIANSLQVREVYQHSCHHVDSLPWSYHAKPARLRFGANSSMI